MTKILISGKGALRIAVAAFQNYSPVVISIEVLRAEPTDQKRAIAQDGDYLVSIDASDDHAEIFCRLLTANFKGWGDFSAVPFVAGRSAPRT